MMCVEDFYVHWNKSANTNESLSDVNIVNAKTGDVKVLIPGSIMVRRHIQPNAVRCGQTGEQRNHGSTCCADRQKQTTRLVWMD